MSAAVAASPFELTVVQDMTVLLEQVDRVDWLAVFIDMRHSQAKYTFHELFARKVTERVAVLGLLQQALPDRYEQISFIRDHGGFWQSEDYTGGDFLDMMSRHLSWRNNTWTLLASPRKLFGEF